MPPFVLTLDECLRINKSLLKSVQASEQSAILEIVAGLKESDTKGKLKFLADSKLGGSVSKLCKSEDATIAAAARVTPI